MVYRKAVPAPGSLAQESLIGNVLVNVQPSRSGRWLSDWDTVGREEVSRSLHARPPGYSEYLGLHPVYILLFEFSVAQQCTLALYSLLLSKLSLEFQVSSWNGLNLPPSNMASVWIFWYPLRRPYHSATLPASFCYPLPTLPSLATPGICAAILTTRSMSCSLRL